jgi:hypothetical protein
LSGCKVEKFYSTGAKQRGKQMARVAATRKLVGVIYYLMKEQIDYGSF